MKTLLIYPSAKGHPENKDQYKNDIQDMEPLAIGYIGKVCENRGHEVRLIHQLSETNEDIFQIIDEMSPDYVMISSLTFNFDNAVVIARHVKERYGDKIKTIIGGYHVSGSLLEEGETKIKRELRAGTFDFAVRGEGEKTIEEIMEYIERGDSSFSEIKGIAFYDDIKKEVAINEMRDRMTSEEIDEIGIPIRKGLPMARYKDDGLSIPPKSMQSFATIYSQRGCSENCEFCQTPAVWNDSKSSCKKTTKGNCTSCKASEVCESKKHRVTSRSVESIMEEIEYLIKEYGTNCLFFRDETFGVDKEKANKLLDEMIRRGLGEKVKWTCFLRADSIVDEEGSVDYEFLRKIKKAGCHTIPIGIEHPLFLEGIKKGVTQEQIKKAFQVIHEIGLNSTGLIMIGWPEETKESLNEVLDFIKEINPDRVRVSFVTPFEGTPLYKRARFIDRESADMTADDPVIHCPELEAQLQGENFSEYLKEFRSKILSELYNSEAYKEKKKSHIENAEKNWGKKWGPILIRSHLEHLDFIREHEVETFENRGLKEFANKKLKEIQERQNPPMLGGTKIK